ncbi:tRNA (adenine(22)-N(1))-methyltransferase [Staphylococcus auricularis]|uniref:tRNA methyltransferase n=1 Tax=Staphylococcus auricularis TaxID=29379 RepID=A0ABX5IGB1_9STAP|nr:tRNA (adenine(22)-N(1))-methyltransferase TrmK [Staphylococcus auricularis]MCE5038170.1 tRNA (adenine-N(1))-methyltransferase [Staphylococcus auricularis]MEB6569311.1 tRNA (adenine(22)-N(1))-methyltransferase TrmK [Staphylococcus auricularis]PTH17452.1 tRNA methyltransferase [Staphylococcus auricularis]PTH25619.1 tRNA methyltransferase [Staphylococcus auricularis]
MIPLNQRLKQVSQYIKGDMLADIGSDHAYLPLYALEQNLIQRAIAGEVIKGPYNSSKQNVANYQAEHAIDVRLGDGLSVIQPEDHVSTITICGMGGPLIAKILTEGQAKLEHQPRLVLQSNIQTKTLRYCLQQLSYRIIAEEILVEKGHIYEIVVADYATTPVTLSEIEATFGPYLIKEKTDLFYKKWEHEQQSLLKIKQNLDSTKHAERLQQINHQLTLIDEVIRDENQ